MFQARQPDAVEITDELVTVTIGSDVYSMSKGEFDSIVNESQVSSDHLLRNMAMAVNIAGISADNRDEAEQLLRAMSFRF